MKSFRRFFLLSLVLTLAGFFTLRDLDNPYTRSINGDGKGYYAYLPAIFIYHDLDYGFTQEMEKKYYPTDESHRKDFKNEQRNGRFVNKYFPGISLLYLPFFLLAMVASWLCGYPVDGYSLPFQLGIGLAHLFYYFWGLWLLFGVAHRLGKRTSWHFSWALILTLGTNCWYYLVYDHTVTHLFLFFLSCVFIWLWMRLSETENLKLLGWIGVLLGLIVITRPTGLLIVGFVPFLLFLKNRTLGWLFALVKKDWKQLWPYALSAAGVVLIAPVLWKLQSGLWLVYSYNEEGFDFLHPNTWNYLFSYQKGWLLWSPALLVCLVMAFIGLLRQSWKAVLLFFVPLALVVYVLSAWWCWTYGMGIGQRTMIEYYPFIFLAVLFFLYTIRPVWNLLFVPLMALNLIQSYQLFRGIYASSLTTKQDYWAHFLQLKTTAPDAAISPNWQHVQTVKAPVPAVVNGEHAYSFSADSDTIAAPCHVVVDLTIGGKNLDPNIMLVLSSESGAYYDVRYLGNFLYSMPRGMGFVFDVNPTKAERYKAYIWNGNTTSEADVRRLKMTIWE